MTPEELASLKDQRAEKKEEKTLRKGSTLSKVWLVLFVSLALITLPVFVQNPDRVDINYLFGSSSQPLRIIILASVALGIAMDRLLVTMTWWSRRRRVKRGEAA